MIADITFVRGVGLSNRALHDKCYQVLQQRLELLAPKQAFRAKICRTPLGKPFFWPENGWHFSISHTKDAAMVLLSDCPCGCDLQAYQPIHPRLPQRVCTGDEQVALDTTRTPGERQALFFALWTAKEACAKALGQPLLRVAPTICVLGDKVLPSPAAPTGEIQLWHPDPPFGACASAICLLAPTDTVAIHIGEVSS